MPRKKFSRAVKGKPITALAWNELVTEVERLSNLTVSAPLSMIDDAGGVSIRIKKSGSRYHSHQAKTNEEFAVGATGMVSLYIEEVDTSEDVEATASPTIAETIPTNTWVDLEWRPTSDGAGRWEITGYYFECP